MQESKKKVERFYDLIKIKSHFKSLLIFKSLVIACFALILPLFPWLRVCQWRLNDNYRFIYGSLYSSFLICFIMYYYYRGR